jgi:hypothetical protein
MDAQNLAWIVIGIALFGFGIYRQFVRRPVEPTRLLLVPVALGAYGLVQLAKEPTDAASLAWLALDLAVAVALGVWRGRTMRVWRADGGAAGEAEDADGGAARSAAEAPSSTAMSQGTRLTAIGWGASIAIRVLVGFAGATLGMATGLGGLLLAVGATFAAQNAVLVLRSRRAVLPAEQPVAS